MIVNQKAAKIRLTVSASSGRLQVVQDRPPNTPEVGPLRPQPRKGACRPGALPVSYRPGAVLQHSRCRCRVFHHAARYSRSLLLEKLDRTSSKER